MTQGPEDIAWGIKAHNYSSGECALSFISNIAHFPMVSILITSCQIHAVVVALTFTMYDYISTAQEEVRGLRPFPSCLSRLSYGL